MVDRTEREKNSAIVCAEMKGNSFDGLEEMNAFVTNQISIRVKSDKRETMALQLFNEQGKLVRFKQIVGEVGMNLIRLDNIGQLSAGSYFLQLKRGGNTVSRKIIKQ